MTDEQRKGLERLVDNFGNLCFSAGAYDEDVAGYIELCNNKAPIAKQAIIAFVEKLCEQPKS